MGQEFGCGNREWVWFRVSCETTLKMSARATVIYTLMGLERLLPKRLPDMVGKSVPSFLFFPPVAAENVGATTLDCENKGHGRAVSWKEPGV